MLRAYMLTCLHDYMLTCLPTCMFECWHDSCLHACIITCVHSYMHVRTCLHTYMSLHAYLLACLRTRMLGPWGPLGTLGDREEIHVIPGDPWGALGIPGDIWEILCASRNPASPSSVSSGARKLQHSGNVAIKMEQTPGEKSGEHVPGCGAQVACAGQSVPEAPFSTIRALPSVHQVHQKGECHGPGSK